ncbi:DUF5990 family protein [Actinopolymorpha sp. B17G11]|uniref:DUF5990 family protein n=1 Tax=Actinopolymorpha sp. B17G11 TaxID=3160861 RepID=UPI0032E3DCF0
MTDLSIRILGRNMPSDWCRAHDVPHLGLSKAKEVVSVTPTTEPAAAFELTVDAVRRTDGLDYRGPYVFGRKGERFLYLNWGRDTDDGWTSVAGGGRIKLQLLTIEEPLVESALEGGRTLVADLDLTGGRGGPVFASVRAPALIWRVD